MQKNWYVIYTKPRCEQKVASLFTKRKIENFYPVNCKKIKSFRRIKIFHEPLFRSYVFVNVTPAQMVLLKQIRRVVSILYWKQKPAIIKQDEIDAIKDFANNYRDIKLEQVPVDMRNAARIVDGPSYSVERNFFAVQNKTFKIILPSLGYIMVAKMEEESIFGRDARYKTILEGIHNKAQQQ